MTEQDLRAFPGLVEMTQTQQFDQLFRFFEQNCPFVGKQIADPTSIVRNEGMMSAWFELCARARKIHLSPKVNPPTSTEPQRLYPDPDKIQSTAKTKK